jgi:hypothetical protein
MSGHRAKRDPERAGAFRPLNPRSHSWGFSPGPLLDQPPNRHPAFACSPHPTNHFPVKNTWHNSYAPPRRINLMDQKHPSRLRSFLCDVLTLTPRQTLIFHPQLHDFEIFIHKLFRINHLLAFYRHVFRNPMIPNNLSDSLIPDILEINSNRMIALQSLLLQGGEGGTPYASSTSALHSNGTYSTASSR